jgi:hypothetical protein
MTPMRERIMVGLRMAGDKVREFDHSYASRVSDLIEGDPTKTNPIRGLLAILGGAEPGQMRAVKDPGEQLNRLQQAVSNTWEYGAPAAGIGIRYGIPAAGVHMGIQGIQGAANYFGSTADEPSPAILPLNQY